MNELYKTIEQIGEKIKQAIGILKLDEKQKRIVELHEKMTRPDFWKDAQKAAALNQELARLEKEISAWLNLQERAAAFLELAQGKDELPEDWVEEANAIEQDFKKMETALLLSAPYDSYGAIFSINAGVGGTDAQDWAEMLLRMYLRFCEKRGWKTKILWISSGAEAGIKSVEIEVEGDFAYGYLKCEAGVHRLVRISPFDAEKMRHTSFALAQVLPIFPDTAESEIKDDEIKVDVFRSSGHGGQSVNTTDSAVRITHLATGIVVTCQNERSQAQNKKIAMKVLQSKVRQYNEAKKEEEKKALRGEYTEASWGNQIRSYVLQPYKMVKDHRTEVETSDVDSVLDGDIDAFIEARLKNTVK
ncbi:peptide chain release factor 2 [Candidatus Falkowbacteria bacterium]|nr:peptide chain release factor 2 [Candidatus Falkowbacteria bacterium]